MKKICFLIAIFMMAFISSAWAQAMQEIVYLKNGSVIKGVVIEQMPGVSLKIKTNDGSIFAYQMSEVEKITKEEVSNYRNFYNARTTHTNSNSFINLGYRGFVDFGYTLGVGDYDTGRLELSTSHGYQIIPQLYIGGGIGLHYYLDGEEIAIPIYTDIRTDILNAPVTPFFDLKIGYTVTDLSGLYLSPSIGCSFRISNGARCNIGIGYVMQKAEIWGWDWYDSINLGGISFKVGFDF